MRVYRLGSGGCLVLAILLLFGGLILSLVFRSIGMLLRYPLLLLALVALYFFLRRSPTQKDSGPEYTITDDEDGENS